MNPQEIHHRVITLAAKRFDKNADAMVPDADFFDVLGIDSYQAMELLTELEDAFDVEIPDYEVQDVRTFSGIAAIIGKRL